jgi:hypothetical protein
LKSPRTFASGAIFLKVNKTFQIAKIIKSVASIKNSVKHNAKELQKHNLLLQNPSFLSHHFSAYAEALLSG